MRDATLNGSTRRRAAAAALAAFVLGVFAYSVAVRRPWFGQPADGHHFWLTAHSWLALENWCEEGAIASRFLLFDNPASIEHRSLADRHPYVTYPVGTFLPPYLLLRATGCRPTPAWLMGYDLAGHLAVAAALALLGFGMARRAGAGPGAAACFGGVPAAVVLLAPGPMYWLQNVYFADQAVMVPFAAALALEWWRDAGGRGGRWARALQPAVIFWGLTVDYLFAFVAAALFVARAAAGEYALRPAARRRAALRFAWPAAAALVVFLLPLAASDGFDRLLEKARERSGPVAGRGAAQAAGQIAFWIEHARPQYGESGVALLVAGTALAGLGLAGLALAARRRRAPLAGAAPRLLGFGLLAALPCFAQLYALRQHSSIHDFSVLKLAVPLALVPWVCLPLALLVALRASRRALLAAALVVTAGAGAWLAAVHPGFVAQFPAPTVAHADATRLLRRHAGYADVVFSPDLEIALRPPQKIAMARKRVYRVADPAELERRLDELDRRVPEPYRLALLFADGRPRGEWRRWVRGVQPLRDGKAALYLGVPRRAAGTQSGGAGGGIASPP